MMDLSWIVGCRLEEVQRRDYDWLFLFTGGVSLVVGCPWRLLAQGRIRVSADDDGQQFGLPQPIDAEQVARDLLAGRHVRAVAVRPGVLDLRIEFEGDHTLEALPVSSGYEAWQIHRQSDRSTIIAVGGGELARFVPPE